MARLLSIVLTALVASIVSAEDLASCGSSNYYPSQYTCFDGLLCPIVNGHVYNRCGDDCYSTTQYSCLDGNFLCPIINGEANLRCGDDACYAPSQYSCISGQLTPCVGHFGDSQVCNNQGCLQLTCCAGLFSVADKCRSPCDFTPCT
ncbi:hypothetical protein B0H10DRAFT_2043985 [Mycena sp. CBHHK59/15]|nr:hypothetical protein B0H10DRAFT_2043985 [Mycena sp. CBHHK59/15]